MGLIWQPLHRGQLAEAERLVLEAIPRAVRVGHDDAKSMALWALAGVYIAKGYLESAERTAREAVAFGESCHFGFQFILETTLAGILLYRDQTEEALSRLTRVAVGPATLYNGFPEGLLALGMAAAEMQGAANECTAAMRFLPRPGTSRSFGAWNAVLSLTEALCLSGRREEAARLQAEAEKIAAEWDCNMVGFPVLTAAGIAAACAGNWTRAEAHHRAHAGRALRYGTTDRPLLVCEHVSRTWRPWRYRGGQGATPGFHRCERCDRARAVCPTGATKVRTIRIEAFPKND